MAQFTLKWDNTDVLANPNVVGQRASYKAKTAGAWITAGFTPTNDLPTSAITVTSPVTAQNVVYTFKVEGLCTINGPQINDNGPIDKIEFTCLTPTTSQTETTATITLDLTGTDITKARFTLRLSSDNSIPVPPSIVTRVGNSVTLTDTGLVGATNYYWQVELYANINNIEVISSSTDYLGAVCAPYPFTTDAVTVCDPITAATLTALEI